MGMVNAGEMPLFPWKPVPIREYDVLLARDILASKKASEWTLACLSIPRWISILSGVMYLPLREAEDGLQVPYVMSFDLSGWMMYLSLEA